MGDFSAGCTPCGWPKWKSTIFLTHTIYFPIKAKLCLESKYKTQAQLFILSGEVRVSGLWELFTLYTIRINPETPIYFPALMGFFLVAFKKNIYPHMNSCLPVSNHELQSHKGVSICFFSPSPFSKITL